MSSERAGEDRICPASPNKSVCSVCFAFAFAFLAISAFLLFISLAFCSLWGHLKAKLAFVLYRSMHGLKAKFAYVLYRELYRPHALFEGKVCLCYIGDGSCSDCNSCNGLKDGRLYLRKSFQTPSTSTNHIFFEPKHQPFNSDLWEVFRYFILNYPTNEVSPLETSERSSDPATGSNNKQMPCKTNRLGTGAAGCLQRT